jgi:ATP-dependent Clp protease ATP-binding subunit ClpC
MFELLTEAAGKALLQAQEEALRLDHDYTDSAHIVLGLLGGKGDPAAEVLRGFGVDLERGRVWMAVRVGRGSRVRSSVRRPQFTLRAKKAIELALREALVTRQEEHTGTGLILLELLREGEAAAMRMLIELGAQPEMIRLRLLRMQEAVRPT